MGQARNRGSFEKRMVMAIERDRLAEIERQRREAEMEAALTPEQRHRRYEARMRMASLLALAGSWVPSRVRDEFEEVNAILNEMGPEYGFAKRALR